MWLSSSRRQWDQLIMQLIRIKKKMQNEEFNLIRIE